MNFEHARRINALITGEIKMLTVYYHYYSAHVGWFWTSHRVEGLEIDDITQDLHKAMED